ncbi:MAG: pseudoazurin [Stappiaceae bacterium]
MFMRMILALGIAFVFLVLMPWVVLAETHVVEMRNADPENPNLINLFTPAILKIQPGDTVKFAVVDKGHNSASKRGMLPEGAEPWNGKIDEELEVSFDIEGIYGYVCLPHYSMGMVGLILVGDYHANLGKARAVKQRGKAKKNFRALFEQVDALKSDRVPAIAPAAEGDGS